jgi:LPXTG-motif cell wall-anchored protein
MTTTVRQGAVTLTGLLLLSLLVLAVSLETSKAITPAGAGVGGGSAAQTLQTQAQVQTAMFRHGALDRMHAAVAPVATVPVAASTGTSVTTWIIIAAVLGALAIGVWAFVRRRRGARLAVPGSAFCSLNPEDARCSAA